VKKLNYLFIAAILWSSGSRADQPGVHGMLLFGNQSTYVSHLPMFHSPHDYQLLFKVSLRDYPGSKTVEVYKKSKKNTSEYFTLVPEIMDLSEIISGAKTIFSAEIYKGHFERGGQSLGLVQVHVEKLVFSKKLKAQDAEIKNSYIVFGEAGEYFAAHIIQGQPSYDAILSVNQPFKLSKFPCRLRYCPETRMIPGVLVDVKKVIYNEEGDLAD
jgi:hypothetical protein